MDKRIIIKLNRSKMKMLNGNVCCVDESTGTEEKAGILMSTSAKAYKKLKVVYSESFEEGVEIIVPTRAGNLLEVEGKKYVIVGPMDVISTL